jgi:hypothetical protein
VRATRLSRVAVIGYISHRRAAFTGMQLSQACSSHRCAALTGYASLTGVQLTGHVAHRVSDLGKKRDFWKKGFWENLPIPNRSFATLSLALFVLMIRHSKYSALYISQQADSVMNTKITPHPANQSTLFFHITLVTPHSTLHSLPKPATTK